MKHWLIKTNVDATNKINEARIYEAMKDAIDISEVVEDASYEKVSEVISNEVDEAGIYEDDTDKNIKSPK